MSRVAWVLTDPITSETYSFPVNPYADGGSFNINKTIAWSSASGLHQNSADNTEISSIVHANGVEVERFSFTGKTYSLTDYDDLRSWVNKDYEVMLTDDLGREFMVLFERIQTERIRGSGARSERLSYTLTGFITDNIADSNAGV
jgi:hypothetical protein